MLRSRIIKPDFWFNEHLARVSDRAKLLFIGLWQIADREGRLEYRPERIGAYLFAYERKVDIPKYISELEEIGAVFLYGCNGCASTFLQITNFLEHQRPHSTEKQSVIPPPEKSDTNQALTNSHVNKRESTLTHENSPRGRIQYQYTASSNSKENIDQGYLLTIPMTKGEYGVTEEAAAAWREAFPAVDVDQALRNIKAWNEANTSRRKASPEGMRRHIVRWLTSEQNKGGSAGKKEKTAEEILKARGHKVDDQK